LSNNHELATTKSLTFEAIANINHRFPSLNWLIFVANCHKSLQPYLLSLAKLPW